MTPEQQKIAIQLIQELSTDLESEIDGKYSPDMRDHYASMKRKYDQDIDPVLRAKQFLQEIRNETPTV